MNLESIVGLVIAAGLFAYLVVTLIWPELPHGAEINMIISCGIRDDKGVWGDRMRIPFDQVYHHI